MAGTPFFAHYSPDQVIAVWGPVIFDGFSTDSFISVTMAQDAYTKTVGVDGKVTRNKILDRSGRIEFTLSASSATNDLLSAAANLDFASPSGAGVAPISIQDHNGRLTFSAAEAWIAKMPDFEFAQETSDVVWAIDFARCVTFIGGR